jgi:hypothetical protein
MLDTGVFPEGMSEHELRGIYAGLSEDLKAAALNAGGPRAVAALERANELNKQVVGVEGRAQEGSRAPAEAGKGLRGRSSAPRVRRQRRYRNACKGPFCGSKGRVAGYRIDRDQQIRDGTQRRMDASGLRDGFPQLSDRGKALLFRSVGSGDVLPFLNDIAEVSQKFVDRGKLANTSGTAGHNALYATGGAVLSGLARGSFVEPSPPSAASQA